MEERGFILNHTGSDFRVITPEGIKLTPSQKSVSIEKELAEEDLLIEPSYKGVRGWLLWLCLGLTVFGPVLISGEIINSYKEIGANNMQSRFPDFVLVVTVLNWLKIALVGFGIFTGISLFAIWPNAIRLAKEYILTTVGFSVLEVFVYSITDLPDAIKAELAYQHKSRLLPALLWAVVWYLYLSKSKRIKATYGPQQKESLF